MKILTLLFLVCILTSCEKFKVYPVKEVVITIDDAPNFPENTSKILDVLNKHNVHATMFCIGMYLEQYPDLAERIANEQTMANHSYSHISFKDNPSKLNDEVYKTQNIIDNLNLKTNKFINRLFRFPYGACTDNEQDWLKDKGFTTCWWDLDASDWDNNVTVEDIINYYDKNVYNKSECPVILFHLSDNSVKSLDLLLSKLERENVKIISLQEKLTKK